VKHARKLKRSVGCEEGLVCGDLQELTAKDLVVVWHYFGMIRYMWRYIANVRDTLTSMLEYLRMIQYGV
jgi:hypothetical protein